MNAKLEKEIEKVEEAKQDFMQQNNLKNRGLLIEATNLCLKGNLKDINNLEEKSTGEKLTISFKDTNQKLNDADKKLLISIFKIVSTEVCKLTPSQIDALWCTELLATMQLTSVANRIVDNASNAVCKMCLFDRKSIVLKECFPEYYDATYGHEYDILKVLNAKGNVLKTISSMGAISNQLEQEAGDGNDEAPKKSISQKGTRGKLVDELILEALQNYFSTARVSTVNDQLTVCANAKQNGLKKLGLYKILVKRGIYNNSFLDFYYESLSPKDQLTHLSKYMNLREKTQEPDRLTDFLKDISTMFKQKMQEEPALEK